MAKDFVPFRSYTCQDCGKLLAFCDCNEWAGWCTCSDCLDYLGECPDCGEEPCICVMADDARWERVAAEFHY